ncbi:hypothetical protein J807_2172 [Acinetobacter sp. 25977_4]|nr:hypothetical protein J604_1093 [Acinetobacter sp. 694762]EXS46378.1 hypothetical protein J660_1924 [Acinetobacter sp. 88816]EXT50373.1 hypothetical protein J807_2172 [Acinetobacter sp. 25977_4]EYT21237.1 hypothetical protein J595_00659 [Acinetobacter sp. 1592897]KCX91354.1 hypothetical protein J568_3127 [Acinetobacter baumannii 6112]
MFFYKCVTHFANLKLEQILMNINSLFIKLLILKNKKYL